jgi:hypothetical protein
MNITVLLVSKLDSALTTLRDMIDDPSIAVIGASLRAGWRPWSGLSISPPISSS